MGLADTLTGYAAVSAVMMALYHRDTVSGRGQVIDLSLLEPMMTAVGPGPSVYSLTGRIPPRAGNRSVANAPRNTYRTADGRWVAISTSATAIAERVMRLVGRADVVSEPWFASAAGRVAHVDLLDGAVADWIGARSFDDVVAAFEAAEAAVAPIYTAADLCDDPHVRSTGMLTEVADEHFGSMLMGNVLFRMSETPGSIRFTGRDLGADTDEVLGEIGVDERTIEKLRGRGVLA
jgi:crotonobetainyl-CoA:carnitine CoA-transferase CaiB-like acyl-CoA transferase